MIPQQLEGTSANGALEKRSNSNNRNPASLLAVNLGDGHLSRGLAARVQ